MESVQPAVKLPEEQKGKLLRILGVTFGIAVTIGGMIGLGILRTPGTVATQLGNFWLILVIWILGRVYSLLGTISVAEIRTNLPKAGGWYVCAGRAFGDGALYLKSFIRTTSLVIVPRARASCFPSSDQAKLVIISALKSVNCCGGLPSIGWLQMLETPPRLTMYVRVRPSGDHRMRRGTADGGRSKTLMGSPPSNGPTVIFFLLLCLPEGM